MDLVLNADALFASITNWDQEGWDAQSASIPWNYTIQIDPPIPDFQIELLNTGRQVEYSERTVYDVTYNEGSMVSTPRQIQIQLLLPLAADPNPSAGTTTDTTTVSDSSGSASTSAPSASTDTAA